MGTGEAGSCLRRPRWREQGPWGAPTPMGYWWCKVTWEKTKPALGTDGGVSCTAVGATHGRAVHSVKMSDVVFRVVHHVLKGQTHDVAYGPQPWHPPLPPWRCLYHGRGKRAPLDSAVLTSLIQRYTRPGSSSPVTGCWGIRPVVMLPSFFWGHYDTHNLLGGPTA